MIKVIGVSQYDAIKINNQAEKYNKAIEKRFRSKYPLICRRITTKNISSPFLNHIEKLFNSSERLNHDFQVSVVENFNPLISYQIFDDEFLVLGVSSPIVSGILDHSLLLYTDDKEAIDSFRVHFDRAWDSMNYHAKSFSELKNILNKQ